MTHEMKGPTFFLGGSEMLPKDMEGHQLPNTLMKKLERERNSNIHPTSQIFKGVIDV